MSALNFPRLTPSDGKPERLNAQRTSNYRAAVQANMPLAERPNKKPRVAAYESAPAILPAPAVSKNVSSIANEIHLTPELIARIATYAEAVDLSELWNICLAVGPATSQIIRHYYLKKNHHFLTRCIRFFCSQKITNKKARDYHLAWMAVNTDWKACVNKTYMEFTKLACIRQGDKAGNKIHPYAAFNNPAVAIQIGLMDPLRYLVEKKATDTNSFEWTPFNYSVPPPSLLVHALCAKKGSNSG